MLIVLPTIILLLLYCKILCFDIKKECAFTNEPHYRSLLTIKTLECNVSGTCLLIAVLIIINVR